MTKVLQRPTQVAVLGRRLRCPQKKNHDKIDWLTITPQVIYVLEFLHREGPTSSHAVVREEDWTSVQLGAIVTRLRNGGFVEDVGKDRSGMLRQLTDDGRELLAEVRGAFTLT